MRGDEVSSLSSMAPSGGEHCSLPSLTAAVPMHGLIPAWGDAFFMFCSFQGRPHTQRCVLARAPHSNLSDGIYRGSLKKKKKKKKKKKNTSLKKNKNDQKKKKKKKHGKKTKKKKNNRRKQSHYKR
eukprot:NODE_25240_length_594_cov_2.124197.p2 GENE.NODE_25240_length_594_cov_2.124197~~NODE_25240_length_594_cov_2.124197.p2  ORF type:complete len:126 (-),score=63.26 NODE_25240_length_594_cov_2.124197:23-400(-)